MGVADERHPRLAQPQRREEGDAVDDLEHDVGVAADAPQDRPDGPGEDRGATTHAVDDQMLVDVLDARRARVVAGDDRHVVAVACPAGDLGQEVRPRASALRVRPAAIGEHQDSQPPEGCGRDPYPPPAAMRGHRGRVRTRSWCACNRSGRPGLGINEQRGGGEQRHEGHGGHLPVPVQRCVSGVGDERAERPSRQRRALPVGACRRPTRCLRTSVPSRAGPARQARRRSAAAASARRAHPR